MSANGLRFTEAEEARHRAYARYEVARQCLPDPPLSFEEYLVARVEVAEAQRERIKAVADELWARADINDPRTHHYAHWANSLGIALQEPRDCEHGYRMAGGSYGCPACEVET